MGLSKTFDMKDLGDAISHLGMRIIRDRNQKLLYLSHKEYIGKVFQHFNMEQGKILGTPLPPYVKLSQKDSPQSDDERAEIAKIPYASAIGSLMYAMLCTRPDIYYSVGVASRFQSDPGLQLWTAVKSILKYLRRTRNYMLVYSGSDLKLTGYTDSDF